MAIPDTGMAVTARGPVEPATLGRVMMHEHLHSDLWNWDDDCLVTEEKPIAAERREYLLTHAVPLLKECRRHGMNAFVDTTMPPWRAWPTFYREICDAGLGERPVLGLDSGYCSESGPFAPMTFLPPEPFTHMFTHTLPALREMGLTGDEEEQMMLTNPQRIIPIH